MTSSKRQRELARAKYERQQARRAAARTRRRRLWTIVSAVAGVLVVVGIVAWIGTGRSSDSAASPTPTAPTPAPTDASPSPSDTGSTPSPSPTGTTAPISCTPPPSPRADDQSWPTAPANELKPEGTYTMSLSTNCGDITMALDASAAPATVNSMVFLADQGYFNLTACHRLTTEGIFVLQCGDPKGDGTGGPGYVVPDENLPSESADNYPAGTVAMANAGPGTAGSQFFIVYKNTTLPPNYTIWGQVTSGLDIVQGIAADGVEGGGTDGAPAQPVSILSGTTSYKAAS